jgi:protein phosphatase
VEDRLYLAHVGDSRCYLFRDGRLALLTSDHSLTRQIDSDPQFDGVPRERVQTLRHILVRALGAEAFVPEHIDLRIADLRAGDVLLLCSDGVSDELSPGALTAILRDRVDPAEAAREIAGAAIDAGGRDNVTALVVRVEPGAQG